MKPTIYTNRRPNGLALDPIKTHLRTESGHRCGQGYRLHEPLRIVDDLELVTCGRCKRLSEQERTRAKNCSVSSGEAG
jgi:hypothetical protein